MTMKPTKNEDALVDVLDVILRDGVVLRADVIVSVAEIPLVGIKLTAVIAGMETMTDYGLFEEWDTDRRAAAVARRQYGHRDRHGRLRNRSSSSSEGRERARASAESGVHAQSVASVERSSDDETGSERVAKTEGGDGGRSGETETDTDSS